ncbi:MAG: prenyltransferase [Proteobacteria bacterium]|nr:prenyltransferase [Pseudomonadota bacterium]HQR04821.1 prenyltransferase [Rhodocyclaceae bacterium]
MADGARSTPLEPGPALAAHPLRCLFLATRPAFLTITAVGVLLGLALATFQGAPLRPVEAVLTLLLAVITHAGANALNDYYDAGNGSDAANTERLYPFTGGSRFIQNGILPAARVGRLGATLLAGVMIPGLWLVAGSGTGLLLIGLAGLLLAWAYSAPPLKLASRGLGEIAVSLSWSLVVLGTDYVQRGQWHPAPVWAGLGYGLMVANLLYLNQFPDATADARAGKRTLVVRLGRRRAVTGYGLILSAALALPVATVATRVQPATALLCLAAALPALAAWWHLRQNAGNPAGLRPAIKLTLIATHLYGLLLAAGYLLG